MKKYASKATIKAGMVGWVRGGSDRKPCNRCGAPRDYVINGGERNGLLNSLCRRCRNQSQLASQRRSREKRRPSRPVDTSERNVCTGCSGPRTYVYPSGPKKGKWRPRCRACVSKQVREDNARHPERALAHQRVYWATHPQVKIRAGMKRYGTDEVWYAQQLKKQNGVCAICNQPERRRHPGKDAPVRLAVDHDHVTGKVRGLLCWWCNSRVAHLEDPVWMPAAMRYLKKYGRPTLKSA